MGFDFLFIRRCLHKPVAAHRAHAHPIELPCLGGERLLKEIILHGRTR
jgi:hypothetical protein